MRPGRLAHEAAEGRDSDSKLLLHGSRFPSLVGMANRVPLDEALSVGQTQTRLSVKSENASSRCGWCATGGEASREEPRGINTRNTVPSYGLLSHPDTKSTTGIPWQK